MVLSPELVASIVAALLEVIALLHALVKVVQALAGG